VQYWYEYAIPQSPERIRATGEQKGKGKLLNRKNLALLTVCTRCVERAVAARNNGYENSLTLPARSNASIVGPARGTLVAGCRRTSEHQANRLCLSWHKSMPERRTPHISFPEMLQIIGHKILLLLA
jgi:hypothetical protein